MSHHKASIHQIQRISQKGPLLIFNFVDTFELITFRCLGANSCSWQLSGWYKALWLSQVKPWGGSPRKAGSRAPGILCSAPWTLLSWPALWCVSVIFGLSSRPLTESPPLSWFKLPILWNSFDTLSLKMVAMKTYSSWVSGNFPSLFWGSVYKMGKVYKGADTWNRLTGWAKSSARFAGRNVQVHISARNDLLGNHVQSFECEVYFLLTIKPADFGLQQLTFITA